MWSPNFCARSCACANLASNEAVAVDDNVDDDVVDDDDDVAVDDDVVADCT